MLYCDHTRTEKGKDMQLIPIYSVKLVREKTVKYPTVSNASNVVDFLKNYMKDLDRENFVVVMLDTHHNIIGVNTVHVGTLNAALVHPREVFLTPLLHKAHNIIIAHNHIAECSPSDEDLSITKRLIEAGKILGIQVLDHIIICDKQHFSFQENGNMT
jgi:DNA repair protein RadC